MDPSEERLVTAFVQLRDSKAVAREIGMEESVVRKRLAETGVLRLYATSEPVLQTYANEEILACYREAAENIGTPLSRVAYNDYAKGKRLSDGRPWPSAQLGHLRWGSWPGALKAAGVRSYRPGTQPKLFSEDQILWAVRLANRRSLREEGRLISANRYSQYAQGRPDLPSLGAIRVRLGWSNALRLALETSK